MGRLADSGVTHGSLIQTCSLYDSLWFFLSYSALFPLLKVMCDSFLYVHYFSKVNLLLLELISLIVFFVRKERNQYIFKTQLTFTRGESGLTNFLIQQHHSLQNESTSHTSHSMLAMTVNSSFKPEQSLFIISAENVFCEELFIPQ